MKVVSFVLFALLMSIFGALLFAGSSSSVHMPLLAVSGHVPENASASDEHVYLQGSVASLDLEMKPGKGRIFVDTYPLTQLDTVISTRLAKEFACEYVDVDCSKYDFFYTIRSNSPLIGGPSAGAAMAIATIAALEGFSVHDVAITGTINSGGLIGVVAGVRQKIDAASREGIGRVMVPAFTPPIILENTTLDPALYGALRGVEVIPVTSIDEALMQLSPRAVHTSEPLQPDGAYQEHMQLITQDLCREATFALHGALPQTQGEEPDVLFLDFLAEQYNDSNTTTGRYLYQGIRKLSQAYDARSLHRYYAAASFCFGASIDLGMARNMTPDMQQLGEDIAAQMYAMNNQSILTLNDLQTLMIVRERLDEAQRTLDDASVNDTYALVYASQRLRTAQLWGQFFALEGEPLQIDQQSLSYACTTALQEAQIRRQYIDTLFDFPLRDDFSRAESYAQEGEYPLCLLSASQAKAQMNVVLSLLGVNQSQAHELLVLKLAIIEQAISSQQGFPLLAYSYYEYALSLADHDISSALLYAEYALELSDLSVFFPRESVWHLPQEEIGLILIGAAIGLLISYFARRSQ